MHDAMYHIDFCVAFDFRPSIHLFVRLSVSLSVSVFICLFVRMSINSSENQLGEYSSSFDCLFVKLV